MEFKVSSGKKLEPDFMVVYGPPGIGKSSFAADAKNPLFIDADKRTAHLNVNRLVPETWDQVFEIIEWFKGQKYDSLVLDTLDALESLAKDSVASGYKKEKFNEINDHGKNWNLLEDEFKKLVEAIRPLREKGKNIIALSHAEVKTINDPLAGSYDRWQPRLYAKSYAAFKDKVDCVFFCNAEILVKEKEKRAFSDKMRYMFTEFGPAFDAKNSFGLPSKFELRENHPFAYYLELKGDSKVTPEVLKRQIETMLPKLNQEDQDKVKKNMEGADDEKLRSIKNKLEVFLA